MASRSVHRRCVTVRDAVRAAGALLACTVSSIVTADVTVAPVFSDHMVLQRETSAPVWGWARPGERVTVRGSWTVEGVSPEESVVAGEDGTWSVNLPTGGAGGPYTLSISGDASGGETKVLSDVLLGDVWLCSGQSNMEWPLTATENAGEAIASANHPSIRLLQLENTIAARPQRTVRTVGGGWRVCSPETVANFSAVGYWLGRSLGEALDVPIGLISADWGGTRIQAWMPEASLVDVPGVANELALIQALDPDPAVRAARLRSAALDWWDRLDQHRLGAGEGWTTIGTGDDGWSRVTLPATLSGDGLEHFDGVVYFRRTVELPPAAEGRAGMLELGPIDDRDDAWVNGVRVGGTRDDGRWSMPRRYEIPAGVLKPGINVIAVRVVDTGGAGGINGRPEQLQLRVGDEATVALAGEWQMRRGPAMDQLPPIGGAPQPGPNTATVLFNGMIAPVAPMALAGVAWYQGESNLNEPERYASLLSTMIGAWRGVFERDALPFLFVQIAPFGYANDQGRAALLREAQAEVMTVPATAMVVTLDVGDPADIHPRDKRTVGQRLARAALAIAHGQEIDAAGPRYGGMTIDGGSIRLRFDGAPGGLAPAAGADSSALSGFTIAGADQRFVKAEARISGDEVIVSSSRVDQPVAVRYAWEAAPSATLFGRTGEGVLLPVGPFRTDRWERPTG